MALGGAVTARRRSAAGREGEERARTLHAAELAWIAAVPCAALVVAVIVVAGPPLSRVLFPHTTLTLWPSVAEVVRPRAEHIEQSRFLLALMGPLLLTGVVTLGAGRIGPLPSAAIARLVTGAQALAVAFLVICYVAQRRYGFSEVKMVQHQYVWIWDHTFYFSFATIAAGAAMAAAIGMGVAHAGMRRRLEAALRERRWRRVAATSVAVAAIAIWLLPAINVERTLGGAHPAIVGHLAYWLDEAFAVLAGRYPLVDYAAQYGSLWPYLVGGTMALAGTSIGVFTVTMATVGAVALLALFATLARVARSTVAGALLFIPVLATGLFMLEGPLANRYAISNLFGTFPLRYAGPLLLAWLLARHLDGVAPRRPGWLFLAAGLVVLNNAEFGVPAVGATVAATLWTAERLTLGRVGRLGAEVAVGLVGAAALVSALTLSVAGSLPHLELLLRYTRIFALAGWGLVPMKPTIGMSTIVYLTYVAAIGVATVRAVRNESDRLMTGLLAWSGVFGLGIGSYYMGRSHPQVLANMFLAWSFSLALLFVVVLRALAARASHRPTLPEAACLLGFGILVCSLAQIPTPWSQVARLKRTGTAIYQQPVGQPFIAAHTRPGETVAILTRLGHRVAYDVDVRDVTPYTDGSSMPTVDQFRETLALLRDAGGRKLFLSIPDERPEVPDWLERHGYVQTAVEPYGVVELTGRG
jgi:hypothetical protein